MEECVSFSQRTVMAGMPASSIFLAMDLHSAVPRVRSVCRMRKGGMSVPSLMCSEGEASAWSASFLPTQL